ncbi:hypothetical protein L0128_00180 [candidate division KSB1 bacterium]|nr:hypothetical protein [candidate division KSB1 bacterium]
MIKKLYRLALLLCLSQTFPLQAQTPITKQDYIAALRQAEALAWDDYQNARTNWEKNPPDARDPNLPPAGRSLARLPALLYSITGERVYAEHARTALINMNYADACYNLIAVEQIQGSGLLTPADLKIIDQGMLESASRALNFWVEWGAMNLATQGIVNNLAAALKRFPTHPDHEQWRQKLTINLSASWGRWSIEDAQIYIPAWIKPIMEAIEILGMEAEYYPVPMVRYYFDYLVQLVTPGGQIVEFGDGRYGRAYTWDWMIAVLEKGASIYRDGRMKWAAHRLFQAHYQELGQLPPPHLCEAYRWADDSVPEIIPTDPSRLVLEDYVGKKIVFRNGWQRDATYLFLNYMDDAPFGIDGKEHLQYTINVEAEKNHHGHADENAINLLMKDGCILLYDAGYRETASTGPMGEYRADVFHNRIVARTGVADSNTRLLPFLQDGGRYQPVQTQLMHFRTFKEVDVSRTRLTDPARGYQWDRVINYLKGQEWFIIFDIVKILKPGPLTIANLFHTQNIDAFDVAGRRWFDTYYRSIASNADWLVAPNENVNSQKDRLLIYFPEGEQFRVGAEQQRRNYQTEWAIYTAASDSFKAGEIRVFTTLLVPHPRPTAPQTVLTALAQLKIFHARNGYGLALPTPDGLIQLSVMLDPEAEYLAENVSPRYNFESGKAQYGDLLTDARYCYLHLTGKKMSYAFFKASKLLWNQIPLFEAPGMLHGQNDGSYQRQGTPKWVAWEAQVDLK